MYGGSILIDVVCLKVGLGYKAEYVNQLFKQVKKTTNGNPYRDKRKQKEQSREE